MCLKISTLLRDEMMAMENKRREEAKEFQETLLNEIKKLGSAIRGGKGLEKVFKDRGLVQ